VVSESQIATQPGWELWDAARSFSDQPGAWPRYWQAPELNSIRTGMAALAAIGPNFNMTVREDLMG